MKLLAIAIGLLAFAGRVAAQEAAAPSDSVPSVTLVQALDRAARLDPDYVAALGQVGDAAWARRAAYSAFLLPSIRFQTTATRFTNLIFNIGTGEQAKEIVEARLEGQYDLFLGGRKIHDLSRAGAEVESASAGETEARFQTALETESDYYDALAQEELTRVAAERVRRAEGQLAVARARVLAGAAVQSDSLQLLLELTRARVEHLQQESRLKVARFQLGRRVGHDGPVRPVALDLATPPVLPLTEEEAVRESRARSPRNLRTGADARAAEAEFRSARAAYLPHVSLFGQFTGFDDSFYPTATTRGLAGVSLTMPLWDNAQRELALSRARTERDRARALREDSELAVGRDVVEAYQNYMTARASAELAADAVTVARENLRVQEERYRAGATTILDLVTAQVAVAQAEAGLVQARYSTRLALAGLEAILGRRLFPKES